MKPDPESRVAAKLLLAVIALGAGITATIVVALLAVRVLGQG